MKTLALSVLLCTMLALVRATSPPVKQLATGCPVGWTRGLYHCFRYVHNPLNWAAAEKHCQALGGNLASVHNPSDQTTIQRMILRLTRAYGPAWLGGSNCQNDDVWLWSDGSVFRYRHCYKFDNGGGKQHCLQMNYGPNKCWDDLQCSDRRPFVCAKKL
ncbi:ladderlectin-like [Xiphias gladius]|uniref:ladderlectin-like n=1 Tax=Xiphias gladius TaxID=8245 RepID=UPI001A98E250|nr:ladderlectin-like [Xiphias gladius]